MIVTTPLENNCFYHVYNRGNNREVLFKKAVDYLHFISLLKKYILPIADIYAYCLLPNHFHLMIKIKEMNDVGRIQKPEQNFSNCFNSYARTFNLKNNRTGKLFQERFKRKKIESESYLTEVIYYIHANPQKHGILEDFRIYPYSSYGIMLYSKETALKREEVFQWFNGRDWFEEYHRLKNEDLKTARIVDRMFRDLGG
ncbi:hypothetical protein D9M68_571150 [compost metagenome]